jgi:hypothetical protein
VALKLANYGGSDPAAMARNVNALSAGVAHVYLLLTFKNRKAMLLD